MKKKILSMVLAGALVLSMSSMSQAAESTITKDATDGLYKTGELKVDGEFVVPTIKVDLSQAGATKIAINPYGLSATVTGVTGADLKEQLVNKVETIENKSEVALAVNATVSAVAEGKAKLATAAVAATEKTNSIFAYLQMDMGDTVDSTKAFNAKGTDQVVFAAKATTKKGMVTLKDASAADSKKAAYKILGNVAPNPTAVWADTDIAKFTIVFDFEPRVVS